MLTEIASFSHEEQMKSTERQRFLKEIVIIIETGLKKEECKGF